MTYICVRQAFYEQERACYPSEPDVYLQQEK
jgi:hypothetical protein